MHRRSGRGVRGRGGIGPLSWGPLTCIILALAGITALNYWIIFSPGSTVAVGAPLSNLAPTETLVLPPSRQPTPAPETAEPETKP